MGKQQRMDDIMDALFDIYSASPYVTVDNTHTRSLWSEWERLENA